MGQGAVQQIRVLKTVLQTGCQLTRIRSVLLRGGPGFSGRLARQLTPCPIRPQRVTLGHCQNSQKRADPSVE